MAVLYVFVPWCVFCVILWGTLAIRMLRRGAAFRREVGDRPV